MRRGKIPRALLVDLDDTILAFDAVSEQVWATVCAQYTDVLPGRNAGALHGAIGTARQWFWDDPERNRWGRLNLLKASRVVLEEALGQLGVVDTELASRIAVTYRLMRNEPVHVLPGAIETILHFKDQGSRLALLTNGDAQGQWEKINRFELVTYFDCIVVEGEFGFGKPDARVFLHALDELGTEPAEAWMVGDNLLHDIGGAQAVGIHGVWVDRLGKGVPQASPVWPDRTVGAFAELRGFEG
jgi:putative hydrolase of the HAD superfamily